ncbi:MAG: UDP-3-O-(3-hydroxymyristoyl)glucosamine N-acyltransferase, partial [Gammaproteobacteria bacterium]|nr:UDP-3-O-(3-hydroxymyristoyl)glucosamine N-acyltransferase [Gammaproteobacteria bacterium]
MSYQLSELAEKTGARLEGGDCQIRSIAEISSARAGDIAFVSNPKYIEHLSTTKASALIIKPEFLTQCPVPALVTDDPRLVYAKVANLLYPARSLVPGVSDKAIVSEQASISESVSIAACAVVSAGATIGAGTQIGAGCVIEADVIIGKNTRINANVT